MLARGMSSSARASNEWTPRCEVLTAVKILIVIFSALMQFGVVGGYNARKISACVSYVTVSGEG